MRNASVIRLLPNLLSKLLRNTHSFYRKAGVRAHSVRALSPPRPGMEITKPSTFNLEPVTLKGQ